jgi:hypothetical protein
MHTSPCGKTVTSVLARAEALMGLLREKATDRSPQLLIEAAIRLCDDLIPAGEPLVALSLLRELEPLSESFTPETVVKTKTAKVASLNSVGRFAEALELAETIESNGASVLQRLPGIAHHLRIMEGTSLWLLNRPEEAIRRLASVRERLLMEPDSHLLADCSVQLCAAHAILGDFKTARDFALDGLVSARRSGNKASDWRWRTTPLWNARSAGGRKPRKPAKHRCESMLSQGTGSSWTTHVGDWRSFIGGGGVSRAPCSSAKRASPADGPLITPRPCRSRS